MQLGERKGWVIKKREGVLHKKRGGGRIIMVFFGVTQRKVLCERCVFAHALL